MRQLFLVFLSVLVTPLFGNITYELNMEEPWKHYFQVSAELSDQSGEFVDFKMPVWAPGSYLVREFEKSVENFNASDSKGAELKWEKVNKSTWRVYHNGVNVKVSYNVYAFEMSVRTSFLDASHGYLNGTSVFMYVEDQKGKEGKLKITPYKEWGKVSTILNDEGKFTYTYTDYDELVDSPIEIGNHQEFTFKAAGVNHRVAMYGKGNYDVKTLQTDMAKIAEACTGVFGENPNKEYLFIIHNLENGSGGLEHKKSTTLQVNRWTYTGDAYIGFLSLVAHEYFHLWNVKRIRPAALGPFNYDEENYTHLLWVMEGFTSYYDELLLLRAGFIDMDTYFNKIYGTMNYIESLPGNKVQPVAMSSFDAWIKAYRTNENSHNIGVSYYSKGAVIAALMDVMMLSDGNGKSLDGFLQHLYKTFYLAEDRGFTSEEFEQELEAYSGMEWSSFLADYVFDTKDLPYESTLEKVGIYVKATEKSKTNLGLRFSEAEVSRIYSNSPAENAGINVNDVLVAINDFYIDSDAKWNDLIEEFYGQTVTVTVARDGILLELSLKIEDYMIPTLEVLEVKPNALTKEWLRTL